MSNVYIENSTLVVLSSFIVFWWICLNFDFVPDYRFKRLQKRNTGFQRTDSLWRFWHYKAKSVLLPIPWAFFFGNLNPQNFHPRQIFMWQHDGLAIPYCCRFNRGPGKNALKRPDKTEIFYSKKMRVNWRSKMCKNHQITGFQSHHKSLIFRRSLLMFNEFWGSENEQENWFLELQTYKEIAFAIKSFTL